MSAHQSNRRPDRRGSLVVEAAIVVILLATAAFALTRLARSSAALNRQADQRLAATLAAENAVDHLRNVAADQLAEKADQVAKQVSESNQVDIKVVTDEFELNGTSGIHVRVESTPSEVVKVTLHDWRINGSDSE